MSSSLAFLMNFNSFDAPNAQTLFLVCRTNKTNNKQVFDERSEIKHD